MRFLSNAAPAWFPVSPALRSRVGAHLRSLQLEHGYIALACLVTPFLLFPASFPLLTALALAAWPMWWLLWWCRRGGMIAPTPLDLPILTLLAVVPFSLWLATDDGLALATLTRFLLGIFWYYALTQGLSRPNDLRWPMALFVGMGLVLSGLAIMATAWQMDKAPGLAPLYRLLPSVRLSGAVAGSVNGDIGYFHPNMIAGTLVLLIPLLIGSFPVWRRQGWLLTVVVGSVLVGMILVVVLAQSRMAWLALVATVFLLFVGEWLWRFRSWLVGLLLVFLSLAVVLRNVWIDLLLGTPAAGSWRSRVEVWEHALHAMKDFPLTGIGLGQFEAHSRLFYRYQIAPDAWRFGHAHNLWLQVGVEFGWLGVAAWAAIIGLTLWELGRVVRSHSVTSWPRQLAIGLIASVFAYLIFGVSDALPWGTKPGFLIWLIIGMSIALGRLAPLPPTGARPGWKPQWPPILLPLACALSVPFVVWWMPLNTAMRDMLVAPSSRRIEAGTAERMLLVAWQRAPRWGGALPPASAAEAQLADWYRERGMPQRALYWYNRAIAIRPTSRLFVAQGHGLASLNDLPGAERAYQTALAIDPSETEAASLLAEIHVNRGETDLAVALLRDTLSHATRRDEDYFLARGRLALLETDWGAAQAAFARAGALHPRSNTFFQQGLAALNGGRPEEAVSAFDRALRLDPYDGWSSLYLGHAYRAQGDLGAAEAAYRRAARVSPRIGDAHLALGSVLLSRGALREAVISLTTAAKLRPSDPNAWLLLARAAVQLRDDTVATTAYQHLLRLDPQQAEAQSYLEKGRAP
ncbi:MAG: O-antigen ligase family protein [Ardenticatenaceae bacterium]|nr:O-antigen ligase family protein [Ardenticatenaceae bacterium]